ncbi:MAG: HAD hydrolase family protein [Cellvibrionales bacterium]|nr:HAD hydrolase family protein [Cellvibrionales bacterium]
MRPLIFTDLDGSLLSHDNYDWSPARGLLNSLQKKNIPVIPNTSKTHSELIALTANIPLSRHHIIENGAGAFLSKKLLGEADSNAIASCTSFDDTYWLIPFANDRLRLKGQIKKQITHQSLRAFTDLSPTEVMHLTGLTYSEAILSQDRLFSEPLTVVDEKKCETDIQLLEAIGLSIVKGGRLLHPFDTKDTDYNKGTAMQWMLNFFSRLHQEKFISIAIGDADNDRPMLEAADFSIVIPNHKHAPLKLTKQDGVFYATESASKGWHQGVSHVLNALGIKE